MALSFIFAFCALVICGSWATQSAVQNVFTSNTSPSVTMSKTILLDSAQTSPTVSLDLSPNSRSTLFSATARSNDSVNFNEDSVVQKYCSGNAGKVAKQAMSDAFTMVSKLLENNNWQNERYRPALTKYMGANCFDNEDYKDWINGKLILSLQKNTSRDMLTIFEGVLKNIVGVQWRWYDILQPIKPIFGVVYVYCGGKYPSWSDKWTPTCQTNTYGWSHGGSWLSYSLFQTYAIGFCTEHFAGTFQPLSTMLQMARVGTADKSNEEVLGGNYGRAAIHQLVELADIVSPEIGT